METFANNGNMNEFTPEQKLSLNT